MTSPVVVHGDIIPLYLQPTTASGEPASICYGAADYRRLIATIFPGPGVLSLNDWPITSNSSAILNIGVGTAIVAGNDAAEQYSYLCRNALVKTIQPPGPPASANRYDLICLTAHDGQIAGDHVYEWQVQCLTGSESATPVVPNVPNDSIALAAAIRRPAAPNIMPADLTDMRSIALLPAQPQSQKYWSQYSSANSPAFTTTEQKDTSFGNIVLNVTNPATVYRIRAYTNVQAGAANNQLAVYVRDGGTASPTTSSTAVAGGARVCNVAGAAGAQTVSAEKDMTFSVGVHTLGVFGKLIGGTNSSSYLTVPSGGQKQFTVQVVG